MSILKVAFLINTFGTGLLTLVLTFVKNIEAYEANKNLLYLTIVSKHLGAFVVNKSGHFNEVYSFVLF